MAQKKAMEDISRVVCCTLDNIGYSREIIESRRTFWREYAGILNNTNPHNSEPHVTIAGSKAEGITSFFESDIDCMALTNDVICTNNVEPFIQLPGMTVFQTDMVNTSPGYTKLKMSTSNGKSSMPGALQESLFRERSGEIFVSSVLFASIINHYYFREASAYSSIFTVHELSGPASPATELNGLKIDCVGALQCINADVLQPFRTRHRQHEWPPRDITEDESSAVCQLVPVGYKGSCDQWKEWRFCFIQTEMNLTHSLNDTQLKMYIVLKMIAKNILKCVSNEISSYIMKNVTYWISEWLGSHIFREENLTALILLALSLLKVSIDNKRLPYYMIPGRNLLAERLDPDTRRNLSDLISQLLDEGPSLLMRCEKLRVGMTALYRSPDMLVSYRNMKESRELSICLFGSIMLPKIIELCSSGGVEYVANHIMRMARRLLETYGIDRMEHFINLLS